MAITLYTKHNCPNCMLIKTMLTAMEIEHEILNVDEDAEAKQVVVDKGFMSAPILQVDDEFIGDVKQIQAKAKELI